MRGQQSELGIVPLTHSLSQSVSSEKKLEKQLLTALTTTSLAIVASEKNEKKVIYSNEKRIDQLEYQCHTSVSIVVEVKSREWKKKRVPDKTSVNNNSFQTQSWSPSSPRRP